jgi:formiminotetrahydrofolate cyclodeaminase
MKSIINFFKNGGGTLTLILSIVFSAGIMVSQVKAVKANQEEFSVKMDQTLERLARLEEKSQALKEQIERLGED